MKMIMKKRCLFVLSVVLLTIVGLAFHCGKGVCWDHEYVVDESVSSDGFKLTWQFTNPGLKVLAYSLTPEVIRYPRTFREMSYPDERLLNIFVLVENVSEFPVEITHFHPESKNNEIEEFGYRMNSPSTDFPVLVFPKEIMTIWAGFIIFPENHPGLINGEANIEVNVWVSPASKEALCKTVRWENVDISLRKITNNRDANGNFLFEGEIIGFESYEPEITKVVNLSMYDERGKFIGGYNTVVDDDNLISFRWGGIDDNHQITKVYDYVFAKPNLVQGFREDVSDCR